MYKVMKSHLPHRTAVFVSILLFASAMGICSGQDDIQGSLSGSVEQKLKTPVTYSCVDESIDIVLTEITKQAGVYVVKSPKVTGNVTLDVVDVALDEVLTNLVAAYDCTYVATESMIRIVPLTEVDTIQERLISRIHKVTYADVADVALALQNFISPRGKVAFNKGTNHIIVTDIEEKIKVIGKFIEQIDRRTPQVLVEVRIYDITSNENFEIETAWNVSRNTPEVITDHHKLTTTRSGLGLDQIAPFLGSGSEGTRTDTTTTTGAVATTSETDVARWDYNEATGNFEELEESEDTTEFVDYGAGLVETDIRNERSGTQFLDPDDNPFNWREYENNTVTEATRNSSYITRRRKPVIGGSFNREQGGTIHISLLNDAIDLDFALSMLHSQLEVKLLASPRVMVLDNEPAVFETITQVPYEERTLTGGGDAITSVQFKPVGVQLRVTPHIARDGMIRLDINPEFGVVTGIAVNGAPTIETRRAQTITLIEDGQTIILGGLRKKEIKKGVDKMPLFGDMPLIGGLFRAETESEITSEMVVFITTSIVNSPVLSKTEQAQYRATRITPPRAPRSRFEAKRKVDAENSIKNWLSGAKSKYSEK